MEKPENNTAQVVADLVKGLHAAIVTEVTDGDVQAPVLLAPKAGGGFELQSIRTHLDQYRRRPERRSGTAILTTIESFIAHTNRFKDADSALFGDSNPEKPSLLAVLDYHCQTAAGDPRFGVHRGHFSFPVSDEWKAWTKADGTKMEQAEFAEFIEDRLGDLIAAPDFTKAETEADRKLKEFADLVGGNFASPSKMVELSRGMAIHTDERVKQIVNLSTGEIQVQYEAAHNDAAGAPLKVPNLFMLAIPVFEGGDLYRIPVRLRYRSSGGRVSWFFELYRADKVFKHAIEEAFTKAATETGLPLFSGSPEASRT